MRMYMYIYMYIRIVVHVDKLYVLYTVAAVMRKLGEHTTGSPHNLAGRLLCFTRRAFPLLQNLLHLRVHFLCVQGEGGGEEGGGGGRGSNRLSTLHESYKAGHGLQRYF